MRNDKQSINIHILIYKVINSFKVDLSHFFQKQINVSNQQNYII